MYSVWPHRQENRTGDKYFEKSIEFNRCIGLYKKENNALAAWVYHSCFGGLQALQTAEEYKRKGFAKLIVKTISKKLATEDPKFDTTLFIVKNNTASKKLFHSLGFKPCGSVYFVLINI